MIKHLSDSELVLHVDNKPSASELEKELANRLDAMRVLCAARGSLLVRYGIQVGRPTTEDTK